MSDLLKNMKMVSFREEEVFCVAYGSNLNEARMRSRCPDSEIVGTSSIPGYRLLFKHSCTGYYATIEQDANCSVPVLIYRMTVDDETRLDRFEGYPRYYYKREFLLPVRGLDGRKLRQRKYCIAYILHENRELGCPEEDYYRLVDDGYERWGFSKYWLEKALSDSIGGKQAETWLKQYRKGTKNT